MTLQVALLGTDGVVLASDRKINMVNQNFNTTATRSKIFHSSERKILAAWSGDQFPSEGLAKHVVANVSAADLRFPHNDLTAAAKGIVAKPGFHGEAYGCAEILVVSLEDQVALYEINASRDRCDCYESPKVIRGHIANPACFFTERFYKEGLSVSELEPLAAHVVVNAGRINPRGIEELEIVRCKNNGFEFAGEREISNLVEWSDGLDAEIRRLLHFRSAAWIALDWLSLYIRLRFENRGLRRFTRYALAMSKSELKFFKTRLRRLPPDDVENHFRELLQRLAPKKMPSLRSMQELITMWKIMWEWNGRSMENDAIF
jgi:hypothetical protein